MTKYKGLYYTTKITGCKTRNSYSAINLYSFYIRNKEGEILESGEEEFDRKEDAEWAAQEAIDEHYY